MYRYDLLQWFTLKEVTDTYVAGGGSVTPYDPSYPFANLFYAEFINFPLWKSTMTPKDHISDLWKLFYARYYQEYAMSKEYDENYVLVKADTREFFTRLFNKLIITYPKYAKLLDLYAAEESKLLDQIKNNNYATTRYNDTPQNEEGSSDFSNDDHVSNISIINSESGTDGMTPIMRLKEVQDHYKSVLEDWSNELGKILVEGGDITL